MTETEVIERVAAETELDRDEVERVLEAAGASVLESARAHGVVFGTKRSGQSQLGVALAVLLGEGSRDAEALAEVLAAATDGWAAGGHDLGQLIEALTPEQPELPTPAAVLQARRNVEARN